MQFDLCRLTVQGFLSWRSLYFSGSTGDLAQIMLLHTLLLDTCIVLNCLYYLGCNVSITYACIV